MTTALVSPEPLKIGQAPPMQNGKPRNGVPRGGAPQAQIEAEEGRSQAGLRVSEADYWAFYYHHPDFTYEWNNGILEERPAAKVQGAAQYRWFEYMLDAYLKTKPIGRIVNLGIGFRLPMGEKTSIRKPDLFVVCNNNPTPIHDNDDTFAGICDLCIESLSDSNQHEIERDILTKKQEYEAVGVREYYILDRMGRYTTFYRRNNEGKYAAIPLSDDDVIRSEVLPGFQFHLKDLYDRPTLIELSNDKVYAGFIWTEYQAANARANSEAEARLQAEARASSEAEARLQAEARIAEMEVLLRQLGTPVRKD